MASSKRLHPKANATPAGQPPQGPLRYGMRKTEVDIDTTALKTKLDQDTLKKVKQLTDNHRFAEFFAPPEDMKTAVSDLKRDLREVPVVGMNGDVTDPFRKIESYDNLTRADKDLIWECLAVVRASFHRADGVCEINPVGGYQWNMNWKHTRAEIDQVLEAARFLNLGPDDTADAILASIFSDSVKNRKNFITHNIDGAYGAAEVLFGLLETKCNSGQAVRRVERVAQAVREHQIAPPEFMARAVTILLCKKLKITHFDPRVWTGLAPVSEGKGDRATICSIYKKISDPFNREHVVPDLHRIKFTDEERAVLNNIGITDWWVPHPANENARVAHAVIAGDHSINYNAPEGFAKIALIRGPDTEAIFEDDTVHNSLDSAVVSFADSFRVLLPEVQPMAMAGLRRTKSAVERVVAIMRELFSGIVVGPVETTTTGAQKIEAAIERAHAKRPELFIVENTKVYDASRGFTKRAIDRVGAILQQWLDTSGEIPFNPKGAFLSEPGAMLPFWSCPLKYPERDENGAMNLDSLSDLERRQFQFATHIRDIAVELLRAEQWIY